MVRSLYTFRETAIRNSLLFLRRWKPVRERVTLGERNDHVEREHVARYEFAAHFCEGKTVADIACGSGYGSDILARVSREVYAFDKEILCGNRVIDLETENWKQRFDVVVSFETIEHLANPEFFLENIRRTTALAIISTPIGELPGYNPHHKQVWTLGQFRSLLERYFICEYYFQNGTDIRSVSEEPVRFVIAIGTPVTPALAVKVSSQ